MYLTVVWLGTGRLYWLIQDGTMYLTVVWLGTGRLYWLIQDSTMYLIVVWLGTGRLYWLIQDSTMYLTVVWLGTGRLYWLIQDSTMYLNVGYGSWIYNYLVVSSNTVRGEVYPIQIYMIKFISDFRQVDVFLRVLQFPPPIKRTATI
jgi:hypothetical protein